MTGTGEVKADGSHPLWKPQCVMQSMTYRCDRCAGYARYMVGMEEGLLPHHRSVSAGGEAIDEERRLCYVGITRAKERLTLSLSRSRMKWGKPRPTDPSRFLFEISGQSDKPTDVGQRPRPPQSSRGTKNGPTNERRQQI